MPAVDTQASAARTEPARPPSGVRVPRRPAGVEALDATTARARLAELRRFHRGEPGVAPALDAPSDDFMPALMDRFRAPERVRGEDPCCLDADAATGSATCRSLEELIGAAIERFAPEPGDARTLKDNLLRLERNVRMALADAKGPQPARDMLASAGQAMRDELRLAAPSDERLQGELERLLEAIPESARLVALDPGAPLHIFAHAARTKSGRARARLHEEVTRLRGAVLNHLRATRRGGAGAPSELESTMGDAASFMDPSRLSAILDPADAPKPAPGAEARTARLEEVAERFDAYLAAPPPAPVTMVGSVGQPAPLPEGVAWIQADAGAALRTAADAFEASAREHAELFAAIRVARLLLDGSYDAARHDPMLAVFDWRAFSTAELQAMPVVVAVAPAEQVVRSELLELSRSLRTGRPIAMVVPVRPATDPGAVAAEDDPLGAFRIELAYLGISHREACVHQSSLARPAHLMDGFVRALDTGSAALHVVACTGRSRPDPWLNAGAAVNGRAHPFLHYDPEAGATWARRIDIDGNPQVGDDWPEHELAYTDGRGEAATMTLRFTFADYALLDTALHGHFRIVPPGLEDAALLPMDEFVALPPDRAEGRLPYLWATDGDGGLHRLVASRTLAFACRDRLDFWHTLQELAGVRNEHVREALERERERLEAEFAAERAARTEAEARAVEQARRTAAHDALQRLAASLVRGDEALGALRGAGTSTPVRSALPEAGAEGGAAPGSGMTKDGAGAPEIASESGTVPDTEPEPPVAVEEEEPEIQEPWIDSALCTTCNDCMAINAQVFVYNAEKQAVIGDATAGTYEQIVRAAEKCPARCIHPGLPLDPSEPDLEALVERAKPFN